MFRISTLHFRISFKIHDLNFKRKKETEVVKKAALELSAEKAIKVQRNSFWPLSSAMVKLAKALNLNAGEVYVQYCPMAKKSWLNEVEAVQNPFYGSMMYDCGEVTEIIAKKN